jgi:hypothetical protein
VAERLRRARHWLDATPRSAGRIVEIPQVNSTPTCAQRR